MVHDGNKDEAEKCLALAQKHFKEGNRDKAKRFAQKAERLYPTKETEGEWQETEKGPVEKGDSGTGCYGFPESLVIPVMLFGYFSFFLLAVIGTECGSLLWFFCFSCFWAVSSGWLCSLLLYSGISISLLCFSIILLVI